MHFRLHLKVKGKPEPLTLTVKAQSFVLNASLEVMKPNGDLRAIVPNLQDTLDFGEVCILLNQTRTSNHSSSPVCF